MLFHASSIRAAVSARKTRLTITVDPQLSAYAEHLVESGQATSVSAVFNEAVEQKAAVTGAGRRSPSLAPASTRAARRPATCWPDENYSTTSRSRR
jgi:hypothetical protein